MTATSQDSDAAAFVINGKMSGPIRGHTEIFESICTSLVHLHI